jgi:hypothetical protein
MRLLSKKHTPIKAYRKFGKAVIIAWYIIGMILIPLGIIAKVYGYALLFYPFFVWICWIFNADFEVYGDRFAAAYGFVLLPCKLVVTEVFFDAIDWMDSRVVYKRGYEKYIMIIHCKNGATKEREFKGSKNDLGDVLYNWKEIANYENKQ